jgi:hypothetical protein
MITKTWNHWGEFTYLDAEFCQNMGCHVHEEHDTIELGRGLQVYGRRFVEITAYDERQELLLLLKYGTNLTLLKTTYHEENY